MYRQFKPKWKLAKSTISDQRGSLRKRQFIVSHNLPMTGLDMPNLRDYILVYGLIWYGFLYYPTQIKPRQS